MSLIFDVETTGLPVNRNDFSNVRIVSIAWMLFNDELHEVERYYTVIKPNHQYQIPASSTAIHGITTDYAEANGVPIEEMVARLNKLLKEWVCHTLVAHNISFDVNTLCEELKRIKQFALVRKIRTLARYCTMANGRRILQLTKFPKLAELYQALTESMMPDAHNALSDVIHCGECYRRLCQQHKDMHEQVLCN